MSASLSQEQSDRLAKARKLVELEEKRKLQRGLPHIHGFKNYRWAREFLESQNKLNFLCAANQISKSSTAIRKAIDWATNVELWPSLWKRKPTQFWYLYPTNKQVNAEFRHKWMQFLPAEEFKDDPIYGWSEQKAQGNTVAIHFNSGVSIYFKTYAQDVQSLQTGTVDAIFCDEELPVEHYDELIFRISASEGYFHMVFTATLGQDFWRRVMDPAPEEPEELADAFKQTVSMYDCMYYEDGSASHWTAQKIETIKMRCKSHSEVLKRVYGKFVISDGLRHPQFDIKRHLKKAHKIPHNWPVYAGIDVGGGRSAESHKSAICYVAVNPNYREAKVFFGWRSDGVQTTAGDVLLKYQEINKAEKIAPVVAFRDWGSADFATIAERNGEPFMEAQKSHEIGETILGTLFENDMLFIYDCSELRKLVAELASVKKSTPKNKAKDDFIDSLRYAVTRIPWDWTVISADNRAKAIMKPESDEEWQESERKKKFYEQEDENAHRDALESEIAEWNELLDG